MNRGSVLDPFCRNRTTQVAAKILTGDDKYGKYIKSRKRLPNGRSRDCFIRFGSEIPLNICKQEAAAQSVFEKYSDKPEKNAGMKVAFQEKIHIIEYNESRGRYHVTVHPPDGTL